MSSYFIFCTEEVGTKRQYRQGRFWKITNKLVKFQCLGEKNVCGVCVLCVIYAPKCSSPPEASRKQFSESKGTVWLTLGLVQVVFLLGLLQGLLKGPECGVRQMKFTHNYGKNAGQFLFHHISHLLMSILRFVNSYSLIQSSKNMHTMLIMSCSSSSSPNEMVLVAACEKYV